MKQGLTKEQRDEIVNICEEFTEGLGMGTINEAGALIIDPLSGYLTFCNYDHTVYTTVAGDLSDPIPVILFEFTKDDVFIANGQDLSGIDSKAHNWMWVEKKLVAEDHVE